MRRRVSAALVVAALFALSGCDIATDPGIFTLQEKRVTFRFEFASDGRTAGQEIEVQSTSSADLAAALLADGYTKGEVVGVTLLGVELSRVQPIGVNLSTLSNVSVSLTASGVSRSTIATAASLPNADDALLQVTNERVTGFITAPSFSSVLKVVPTSLKPNSDYVLTATLRLRVEVEGV